MITLNTVDVTHTMSELAKYRASGTVCQMSTNGRSVGWLGHQVKSPWTSPSGFTDVVIITYSGTRVNRARPTTTTTRNTRKDRGSRTTTPAGESEPEPGDEQQEEQQ